MPNLPDTVFLLALPYHSKPLRAFRPVLQLLCGDPVLHLPAKNEHAVGLFSWCVHKLGTNLHSPTHPPTFADIFALKAQGLAGNSVY